jgi:beta-glucosidase
MPIWTLLKRDATLPSALHVTSARGCKPLRGSDPTQAARFGGRILAVGVLALALSIAVQAAEATKRPVPPTQANAAWLDTSHSFEQRAAALVAQMTLEEKAAQMQNAAPAIERLGVPAYDWWNEALHGVARAGEATVFPQAIGLAATFDIPLMQQVSTAISDEARAKHHEFLRRGQHERYQGLTFWSPNINIFRDPRWGRGQETYGEDPYLTARMGVTFVKGLQGDDPKHRKLDATAKHFAVHSGPEADRHHFDARPSTRDLYETYLPAFEALVKEGQVAAVMGAYNRLYGESASASKFLLRDVLRQDWGFKGYVLSDCWAIVDIWKNHKIVATREEAAALAVKNGTQLECGEEYSTLPAAVRKGLISESEIDKAVTQLFAERMHLGMFDPPEKVRWAAIPYSVNQSPQHDALARRAARESIVLLKNDGILPLSKNLKRVAVIGPTADDRMSLLGNYFGTPAAPVTILQGIREALPNAQVVYAPGSDLVEGRERSDAAPQAQSRHVGEKPQLEEALDAARDAEVIVFVGGLTSEIEGEEMEVSYPGFAGGDRTDLRLPATQRKLLEALHATGKPVVMVLTAGSAMAVDWAQQNLPAIVMAWYPGQRGGNAVADVLFGDTNPAGRLPVTFYKADEKLPAFDDYAMNGRTYRYFEGAPLYPFGHGLSYTTFAYSGLQLDRKGAGAEQPLRATLKVRNTGTRAGDEVVQLYLRPASPKRERALKDLRGFERVTLQPGEERIVSFTITPESDLRHYDEAVHGYAVDPGEYEVQVGASSADIRLSQRFKIER